MRKKLTESRTYEEALKIGKRRIEDAILVYDRYIEKENQEGRKYFFNRSCPFCGFDKNTEETKFQNRYGVSRCVRCHSIFVNPCPSQELLDDYYNNYACNFMLEDVYKKRAEKKENVILDSRVNTILDYIKKINKDEVFVLDVGCSNGSFLAKIKAGAKERKIKSVLHLFGCDVNKNAIERSVDNELTLFAQPVEQFLDGQPYKFDIIWHSELAEHLIDPYATFVKMNQALNKDGYLIFTTPNNYSVEMENISYNVPRTLACNILPPMHLNAFSTINVPIFAIRCGFYIDDISTPGNFDVEIFELEKEHIDNCIIKELVKKDEEIKELAQNIIVAAHGSSHMQCVLRKPEE